MLIAQAKLNLNIKYEMSNTRTDSLAFDRWSGGCWVHDVAFRGVGTIPALYFRRLKIVNNETEKNQVSS